MYFNNSFVYLEVFTYETERIVLFFYFSCRFDSLENPELEPLEEWAEEFRARNPGKDPKEEGLYLFLADSSPSPRTIKTHLPFSLLNPSLLDTSKVKVSVFYLFGEI